MKNFYRAVRLGLRYRWTLVFASICSLMVAVLWGGNIGAVYPIVEVVFKGQSLDQWANEQIATSEKKSDELRGMIAQFEKQLDATNDPAQKTALEKDIRRRQWELEAEQEAVVQTKKLQPWIERYMPRDPFQTLLLIIGLLLVGTLVKDVFLVAGSILAERIAQRATLDLRKEFYRRTLRMDLAAFNESANSDLLARFTNDLGSMTLGIQIFYGRAVREPLKMVVCLAGAAFICWRLLFLSLIVVPVALLLINSLARSMRRASRRAMEEMSLLYNVLVESFIGIKIVKAFTMERAERWRFHLGAKEFYRKSMKIARYDALVRPTTELMGILMISLAILAGAYLVLNQETHLLGVRMTYRSLGLAELLLFYGLLAGASDPTRKLADVFSHFQRAAAAADRVFEMYDREPKVVDPPRPQALPRLQKEIVVEGIQFAYQTGQQVLHGVDLTIPFGQTMAIVGPNGCGKSTLVNLLPRFFDPQQGRVLWDGIDVRDVRRRELRLQIGLVTQEPFLFDDTVMNNIRYGAPGATAEQAIAAAKQAHADRFITEKLERGYDTMVGSGGVRLSGGQRQRISLARAILRDPSLLILDEATSQVDRESEQTIHRVIADFIRGRTTVLITHRLETLALADSIVVMEAGQILDVGPHDQLLDRCDVYRRLSQLEFRKSA
jgi:ATP-binding cassette subfamily B protein/subfamily B ATP-binding cassette protein MsbA